MSEALVSVNLRLSPEDLRQLRRLVAKRIMETGQRASQNEVMRDLIQRASADAAT